MPITKNCISSVLDNDVAVLLPDPSFQKKTTAGLRRPGDQRFLVCSFSLLTAFRAAACFAQ
jgi:hypothetical protein